MLADTLGTTGGAGLKGLLTVALGIATAIAIYAKYLDILQKVEELQRLGKYVPVWRLTDPTGGQFDRGRYWAFVDPRSDPYYGWHYGIPSRSGRNLILLGFWDSNGSAVIRPALPANEEGCLGSGGYPELYFESGPQGHIAPGAVWPIDPPIPSARERPELIGGGP